MSKRMKKDGEGGAEWNGTCTSVNALLIRHPTAEEMTATFPAVAPKLEPVGKHDACFLPRSLHVTGDIQIHEMVYRGDELWFANTAFSCLCTYDEDHSFVPRWRPPFVTELAPEDRCHLNGLGLVDGKPRWVTALGETNTAGGWRDNKKDGGILIDLETEEIVTRGLSMPHSPRWYAGRLWLLESGTGSLGFVDLESGRYESIVELPGFTRGLDFAGNLAFVGLSQVRETAVFSGIPITERLDEAERTCGVWAVDIRNGQVVAFVKFEEAVQEIFAVSVLAGCEFPDLINDDPRSRAVRSCCPMRLCPQCRSHCDPIRRPRPFNGSAEPET